MTRQLRSAMLISAAAIAFGGAACAHHSFADFDRTKTASISGTVRALEWENPHIWLWINTTDASGKVIPWGFEGAAPAEMARQGFDRKKVTAGVKVTVTYHPLRDGRNGGSFSKIVRADGEVLAGGGPVAPPK